jgi:GDP/UDP-N,N'-diacetylbacillosamine 2-epimerase (hydrolysing)
MSRKICVITGSRAEYGLLRWVIQGIQSDPALTLQLIVTGMHLSPEFGLTYQLIEKDGFLIDRKIEMLLSSDTSIGIAKAMGLGLIGFSDALDSLKPDIVVVLGDRFEIFSAACAALVARIPIAHLHGGETTEGAFDEALRHSITKMSHLHFVATETYKRRVIQLGERPATVFLVGGLGIDSINKISLLSKPELEASLGLKFLSKNLLITFHPVTLEASTAEAQITELLAALADLVDTQLIFTRPNADTGGRVVIEKIEKFIEKVPNAYLFSNLGQQRYLSCISQVDGVVGNSSSGLLEAPSFKKGTINIGQRQRGRIQATSVINCEPQRENIRTALIRLYSDEFSKLLAHTTNPYGIEDASPKVVEVLKNIDLNSILMKSFYDINFSTLEN